ncbi:MAG TPA: DUF1854 domain-containing protein [Limnochordia bacterium]|jgi:Domain of unknown function (DUF1854).|nr:DUF1854 domain-containing protein [Limnochordia bacterium]
MQQQDQHGLSEYVDIRYLDPATARFSETPGGFVRLVIGEEESYPRVALYRAFPFSFPDRYISVRDMDGNEIGMIKDLNEFDEKTAKLILRELERRYFTPVITQIESIKEEFGYAYWDVRTDAGPRRFTVRDMQSNVILLSPEHVLIIDVDGNRYEIPDYHKLDARSRKYIEDLL